MIEIDRLDGARIEIGVRTEPANRCDRVEQADRAGDDLGQHRLEHEVVLAADQPELDVATSNVGLQKLLERQRCVDAAEAAAENEDPRWPAHDASDDASGAPVSSSTAASAGSTEVRWM